MGETSRECTLNGTLERRISSGSSFLMSLPNEDGSLSPRAGLCLRVGDTSVGDFMSRLGDLDRALSVTSCSALLNATEALIDAEAEAEKIDKGENIGEPSPIGVE